MDTVHLIHFCLKMLPNVISSSKMAFFKFSFVQVSFPLYLGLSPSNAEEYVKEKRLQLQKYNTCY